ncbi:hypothetical protein THAOC_35732, partial [Thalassiosira oceanica]
MKRQRSVRGDNTGFEIQPFSNGDLHAADSQVNSKYVQIGVGTLTDSLSPNIHRSMAIASIIRFACFRLLSDHSLFNRVLPEGLLWQGLYKPCIGGPKVAEKCILDQNRPLVPILESAEAVDPGIADDFGLEVEHRSTLHNYTGRRTPPITMARLMGRAVRRISGEPPTPPSRAAQDAMVEGDLHRWSKERQAMIHDVVIIGGGVLGLSILRSSLLAGHAAVLLERNADLCDGASGRNSGVVCTGVDAVAGTLERALIRDSISRVRGFCEEHNVPTRECGSLVCLWPWDEQGNKAKGEAADDSVGSADEDGSRERLKGVLAESHGTGDSDARFVSPREVSELEPSLSTACRGAVHIPGEIVVDPWLFPVALAAHAREVAAASGIEGDVIRCGVEAD